MTINAAQMRTRAEAQFTQEELDQRYAAALTFIEQAADNRFFYQAVSFPATELSRFKTWITDRGFKLISESRFGSQALSVLPGGSVKSEATVSWSTFSVTAQPLNIQATESVTFSIVAQGLPDGTDLYYRLKSLDTLEQFWFFDNTLEGVVTINNGLATVTKATLSAIPFGTKFILELWVAEAQDDLLAQSLTVTIV